DQPPTPRALFQPADRVSFQYSFHPSAEERHPQNRRAKGLLQPKSSRGRRLIPPGTADFRARYQDGHGQQQQRSQPHLTDPPPHHPSPHHTPTPPPPPPSPAAIGEQRKTHRQRVGSTRLPAVHPTWRHHRRPDPPGSPSQQKHKPQA